MKRKEPLQEKRTRPQYDEEFRSSARCNEKHRVDEKVALSARHEDNELWAALQKRRILFLVLR